MRIKRPLLPVQGWAVGGSSGGAAVAAPRAAPPLPSEAPPLAAGRAAGEAISISRDTSEHSEGEGDEEQSDGGAVWRGSGGWDSGSGPLAAAARAANAATPAAAAKGPPAAAPGFAGSSESLRWQMFATLRFDGRGRASVRVPHTALAAWFPGAALPLEISLQLVVDGTPWGPRFPSAINPSIHITRGLGAFRELDGCRIVGLRRAADGPGYAGPPALDLLLSSSEGGEEEGAGMPRTGGRAATRQRKGPNRTLKEGDLEEGAWPVDRTVTELSLQRCRLNIPADLLAAFWPGAEPLPALRVAFLLDGAQQGPALDGAAAVTYRGGSRGDEAQYRVRLSGRLPLPVGCRIVRFVRGGGPGALEVHAVSSQQAAEEAETAAAAAVSGREEEGTEEEDEEQVEEEWSGSMEADSSGSGEEAAGGSQQVEGGAAAGGALPGTGGNGFQPGAVWRTDGYLRVNNYAVQAISVPAQLAASWFPGAALPLPVSLQLEVDGTPWGPRFTSAIKPTHTITKGLSAYKELAGCRLVAFRFAAAGPTPALDLLLSCLEEGEGGDGAAVAGARGRGWGFGRRLEAADMEEGAWPVEQTFNQNASRDRYLYIPSLGFPVLWPGAAPPPAQRVQFVLDGAPQGGPLEARVTVLTGRDTRATLQFARAVERLPLPVGAAILRYRRAGAGLLEVHTRSGEGAEPAGGGAEGASPGPSSKRQRLAEPQQRPAYQQVERSAASALRTPPTADGPTSARLPLQQPPHPQQLAAARLPASPGAQPSEAPATPIDADGAAKVAAALRALQRAAANCPAVGAPGAAAALEEAVFTAYGEVERAAQALGLPLAAVDAVCDGVAAATEQAPSARRFLRMEYPRLVRAAAAGEEGLVRAWMERAAAVVAAAAR